MGERDTEWGIIVLIVAVFFLFAGLDLLRSDVINTGNEGISIFLAFILVAAGVYLIAKK